jgi:hypothetical protein
MALRNPSLFLYGFQVTANNSSIDFRAVALETPRQATLRIGFYSLNSLSEEIKRALQEVDPARVYTVSADRTISGGTQNRVTISTNGAFFELLFLSGPRTASTTAPLIGFPTADQTGFLTYTGNTSAGTRLIPNLVGYQYLSPDFDRKVFGSVNVSASGEKEAIVYNIQRFWQVQFKFIEEATWISEWLGLMNWMIQQRLIEYTPDITAPTVFYEGTLESTGAESKGLGFRAMEMLPQFPFLYDTGVMRFRQRNSSVTFI